MMSEKRFKAYGNNFIAIDDNVENKTYYLNEDVDRIVDLLNNLNDENEQLQRECKSNEHLCEYYRQKYKKLLEDVQENVKGELVIR